MFLDSPVFSGYSTNDISATKSFYEHVLGLEVTQDWMGLKLSFDNGVAIFIYEKEDHVPASFTVLNFPVNDIDAAVDELVAGGVHMERYDDMPGVQDEKGIMRGKTVGQGPDIAWFKDPGGNILSVLSN